ncbi:hypothetical protein L0337_12650 [candidate division KSB1 bacterium]|nr:hypothetical protein [candidate division KSB1 bacterium]
MSSAKTLYISLAACFCLIAALSMQQGCNKAVDISEKDEVVPLIARGPGGPATLIGSVTTSENTTVREVQVYLLKSNDYAAKLAELLIDSLPRTFKIVEIPLGSFDLFIMRPGFFTVKKAGINLSTGEKVLEEPFVLTRAIEDTNLIIPDRVIIEFKINVTREQMLQTIADANCTVKYADTPLTGTGRYFVLDIPDNKTVWEMVSFFNSLPTVEYAVPSRVVRVTGG